MKSDKMLEIAHVILYDIKAGLIDNATLREVQDLLELIILQVKGQN